MNQNNNLRIPPGAPGVENVEDVMESKRSIFNPADAAQMKQGMDPRKMTVREYFGKLGVDVDGPVIQLVKMAKQQMDNKDPLNKMKAMAGSNPMPEGEPPAGPPVGQGPPAGLNDLLQ